MENAPHGHPGVVNLLKKPHGRGHALLALALANQEPGKRQEAHGSDLRGRSDRGRGGIVLVWCMVRMLTREGTRIRANNSKLPRRDVVLQREELAVCDVLLVVY